MFDKAQRDAVAMLFFNSDNQGAAIAQIFLGALGSEAGHRPDSRGKHCDIVFRDCNGHEVSLDERPLEGRGQ